MSDIKRANYSELFFCEEDAADRWFKCKLFFITLDEKSGAEKKTSTQVLVQAADLRDAVKKLDEGMKEPWPITLSHPLPKQPSWMFILMTESQTSNRSFPTQEKPNKDYSDRPNYRLYMSIQAI